MSNPEERLRESEVDEEETSARSHPSPVASPSGPRASEVQFESGRVLAGRYRVVRLLGRGGMGEVYLVHDLTLDQEVALKFLPATLARDPVRLSLFHNEVRVARRVTHKNVCRIYDIGEVDGRVYLSMEYVDGENLGTLLKRIGRLPEDKGLEVTRQLAAGLAVAHEAGIVHRDLKPQNVMIDGTGQAKITDFGLAAVASEVKDVRSGTPAYQAPEQIRGEGVDRRSDLYSLGLILYELFTGQRAFEEHVVRRDYSAVKLPSSAVRELSVETEAAILRCLSVDPDERPSSALELAARLPGADPLADALAAGKTPSPEMVAAAGQRKAFSASRGLACFLAALAGVAIYVGLRAPTLLMAHLSEPKAPAVLLDRAESLLQQFGFERSLEHVAFGYHLDSREARRPNGATVDDEALRFWLRGSPRPLVAVELNHRVSREDPPATEPGMVVIDLDSTGRLVELSAVPEAVMAVGETESDREIDWPAWFEAAGLMPERYRPVGASFVPPVFVDERLAWERAAEEEGLRGREFVEAGSFQGGPVFFRVGERATPSEGDGDDSDVSSASARFLSIFAAAIGAAILVVVVLLARSHWKLGRGDRTGAGRLAGTIFVIQLLSLVLLLEHFGDLSVELERVLDMTMEATFAAAMFWLFYLALEPFARRIWPHGLIAWNRLLRGEHRDPLVGRDVLIGAVFGVSMALTGPIREALLASAGASPAALELPSLVTLLGARYAVGGFLAIVISSVNNAFLFLFLFVVARFFVKRSLVAGLVCLAVVVVLIAAQVDEPSRWLQASVAVSIALATLVRFGLLSVVVAGTVDFLLRSVPLTLSLGAWYASATITALFLISAIVTYGFIVSRAGEPLLGRRLVPLPE